MPTEVHRLPTLPLIELLGDKRKMKAFARRIGRADGSLTVDEYIRFMDEHNGWYEGRSGEKRMRQMLEPIAAFYATFPTWEEGRAALILGERSGIAMTAEQKELRRKAMGEPVL